MAQVITNQANVTYSNQGSAVRRQVSSNVASTTLLDAYGLEISKQSLQQSFAPGENITYAIRVTNTGYRKLNNFTLTDDLANVGSTAGMLTYMPYTARLSLEGSFITLTPTSLSPLTFSIANELGAGESFTLTFVATVSSDMPLDVLELVNTATIKGRAAADPGDPTEYSATDTATLARGMEASLAITKSVSKPTITSTDSYEYTLYINNVGLTAAENIVITDQLPIGFSVTGIRVENENFVHDYAESEYTVSGGNMLTLPNETGTAITISPARRDVDNTTIVTISGNFTAPVV